MGVLFRAGTLETYYATEGHIALFHPESGAICGLMRRKCAWMALWWASQQRHRKAERIFLTFKGSKRPKPA
jgi:hypothetical protein